MWSRWRPATGACPRRGPHPRRQGLRACQPALPPLCRQRRLADPGLVRPDAGLLDPGVVPGRRAWRGRAQDAALPVVAYRRAAGPPRPPAHLVPATHLALDAGAGGGVRAAASPARTLLTIHRAATPTWSARSCPARRGGELLLPAHDPHYVGCQPQLVLSHDCSVAGSFVAFCGCVSSGRPERPATLERKGEGPRSFGPSALSIADSGFLLFKEVPS
jgi:hypothetical protein